MFFPAFSASVQTMSRGPSYRRRRPEETALFQVLLEHLPSFIERLEAEGGSIPRFVKRELQRFLACGIPARGFVRVRCPVCKRDEPLAFSCKGRGICPSCGGRRMGDIAANWIDRVLPDVPMRQWVLSLPYRLRYLMAFDHRVVTIVLGAFLRALFAWQRLRAKRLGVAGGRGGAVTAIQRFGSALNLNPHIHSLAFDGVFIEGQTDLPPRFVELPPPTDTEVAHIVTAVRQRVNRALSRAGYPTEDHSTEPDPLSLDEPVLAAAYAASVQSRVAFGPRAGQLVQRFGGSHGLPQVEVRSPRCAQLEGFNLHANVAVSAGDRDRLENVCRYMCRGAIANDRLEWSSDGQSLTYRLKRPWTDGTTHFTFEPLELIEKLCALIPFPHKNLIRYHGVLAPNAHLRPLIVLRPEQVLPEPRPRRRPWTELMLRVLLINSLCCGNCGSEMAQISTITQPDVIKPFLACIDLPSSPPTIKPARPPPELQEPFDW